MKKGKNKKIQFRVDDDFYDLINKVCEELNCTMTQYFYEHMLSDEYIVWKLDFDKDELYRALMTMSNNMNQIARAMNTLVRMAKEEADLELLLDNQDFAAMSENFKFMFKEVKEIQKLMAKKDNIVFRPIKERKLLLCVQDYLKEHDPEYMRELSRHGKKSQSKKTEMKKEGEDETWQQQEVGD